MTDDLFKTLMIAEKASMFPYIEESRGNFEDPNASDEENANRLDRKQALFGHQRAAFMARHYEELHWCGYVLIQEAKWHEIERTARRALHISYAGQSTKFTSWMNYNEHGRLTIETQLAIFPEPNFWVGFDTMRFKTEERVSDEEAWAELVQFSNAIYGLANGNLTVRG